MFSLVVLSSEFFYPYLSIFKMSCSDLTGLDFLPEGLSPSIYPVLI